MKGKIIAAVGMGAAFVAGAAFGPLGQASAGHANTLLTADLDGRTEVATDAASQRLVGDPDGRGEVYVFGIDGDPTTLCYVLTVDGVATASAAHIHEAAAGVNGPVVANLAAPGDGNAADCLTEGETGKFPGNPAGIVQDILENPADYYVNVHNADYPGGALRGQLAAER
ncbi:MAG: CHRD domain-containing protein [Acidimicrobiales bacterium]